MNLRNFLLMALLGLLLSNCYNDEKVWDALNEQEQRIEALESWQKLANENINALQALIAENDYITSVIPITMDGATVGYTISFKNQSSVSIYNGEKGDKGEQGDKGDKGDKGDTVNVPTISLVQLEDGNWYWTLNGELMKDSEGNAVRANGKDGADGKPGEDGEDGTSASTPLLKNGSTLPEGITEDAEGKPIAPDAVYLSVDGGKEWTKVSGKDGESGTFGGITEVKKSENGMYVEFVLSGGESILVPTKEWADQWDEQIDAVNGNIKALQDLTNGKKFITKVTETENGCIVYFHDGSTAIIKHGEKGDPGKDGMIPDIKIEGEYWYIGDKNTGVKATGDNGKTPEFELGDDGELKYKFEGDDNWTSLGNIRGSEGPQGPQGDAIFKEGGVDIKDDHVIFTLKDGKTIKLPYYSSALRFEDYKTVKVHAIEKELEVILPDNLTEKNYECLIATVTPTSGNGVYTRATNGWTVSVTSPDFTDRSAIVAVEGSTSLVPGDQALLSVILTYKNGTQLTASLLLEFEHFGDKALEASTVGDFYMSDGSLVDKDASLTDIQKTACIGIVYWVGDIKGDNYGLLDSKFPKGTNGLVVSLWDIQALDDGSTNIKWTYNGYEHVNTWLEHAKWSDGNTHPGNFTSIQIEDKMQGYANTMALKEYNKYIENPDNNKDQKLRVKPVEGLPAFETAHPAPSTSSGWYWPSVEELRYVCWGQGNGQGTAGKKILDTQIGKVSGNLFGDGSRYWSSTEYRDYSFNAWYVDFYDGAVSPYGNKNANPLRVRPLLAF